MKVREIKKTFDTKEKRYRLNQKHFVIVFGSLSLLHNLVIERYGMLFGIIDIYKIFPT
jgi:hypothetical protein